MKTPTDLVSVPGEDKGEQTQPMKEEPPDEGMDQRQTEETKLAQAEGEQVQKDRDAQCSLCQ